MNKYFSLKLIVIWFSVLFSFVFITILSLNYSSKIYSERNIIKDLQAIETRLEDNNDFYFRSAEKLASYWYIKSILKIGKTDSKIENELTGINQALQSSIVYIMSKKGDVIASSIYDKGKSLVGNNYQFRDYFQKARSGENGLMMAVGVTTGVRGIFFSSPVFENGLVVGVLVIKVSLNKIDNILLNSHGYCDLISDQNIIFSSKNKDWLYKKEYEINKTNQISSVSIDTFIEGWKLRTIYSKKDLIATPLVTKIVIISFISLLNVMFTIILFLYSINRRKKQIEINLIDRKKEIIRINRGLEKKIAKRTKELKSAENQLIEAEKMAALGNLVAGVSHEINTPIGVSLMASSFLDEKLNDIINGNLEANEKNLNFLKESSNMIIKNLQRSSDIIQTFKEITGETIIEEPQTLNIKDHIIEILNMIKGTLSGTKPMINIECSEWIKFSTYPMAFYHIFSNLIANTIKHGFSGNTGEEISITITKNGKKLHIEYSDNGFGMDCNASTKIFEPFFTTKRGQGETGLGMHIVHNIIVQLYKGNITCDSKLGKGTKFLIELLPIQ